MEIGNPFFDSNWCEMFLYSNQVKPGGISLFTILFLWALVFEVLGTAYCLDLKND